MRFIKNISGFSLMELLVVISIIAILSVVAVISFSKNRSQVQVDSFIELLDDQISLLRTDVLTQNLENVEVVFSLETPRSYRVLKKNLFSSFQNEALAQNLQASSVQDVSQVSEGGISISWEAPQNASVIDFVVSGNDAEIIRTNAATSPQLISSLSQYQKYTFEVQNASTLKVAETLIFQYFSKENISAEERFPLLLTKIEGQNFSEDWVSLQDVQLKMSGDSGKIQVFSGSDSYLNLRLTFEKQDYSTIYELF